MLRQKSLNISADITSDSKKAEKLYERKESCWCKLLTIPLLITFVLIMILTNVDFSGEAYESTLPIDNHTKAMAAKEIKGISRRRIIKSTRGFNCLEGDTSCVRICKGSNTNNIYKELEPLNAQCGNTTELFLYNSNFPAGAMKPKFLQGDFRLKTLAIIDCNLGSIEANAFEHDSVSTLKNLHMINTNFAALGSGAFEGLKVLEVLNVTNLMSTTIFKGEKFLTPLAGTLKAVRLWQETTVDIPYDPSPWLQGPKMLQLRDVNLSNNNFKGKLAETTFENLPQVEVLDLSNCNLDYLPANIFDGMSGTLKYMDLSMNNLVTLELPLAENLKNLFYLNLTGNNWDCPCVYIVSLGKVHLNDMSTLKCCTPMDMKDINITEAVRKCNGDITTFPTTLETSSSISHDSETSKASSLTLPSTTKAANTTVDTTVGIDNTSESMEPESSATTSEETSEVVDTSTLPSTSTSTSLATTTTSSAFESTTRTVFSTTTFNPSYGTIMCRDGNSNELIAIDLLNALVQFTISFHSTTSVSLTIRQDLSKFDLIYFTKYADAVQWSYQSFTLRSIDYSLLVQDLKAGTAYVFCWVAKSRWSISPFDCRGHWVPLPKAQGWIQKDDRTWVVALVVLGICLFLFLGIIVMFSIKCLRNCRKVRCTLFRNHPDSNSDTGTERISESHLTDVRQPHQPDICIGCPRPLGGGTSEHVYYEEMAM